MALTFGDPTPKKPIGGLTFGDPTPKNTGGGLTFGDPTPAKPKSYRHPPNKKVNVPDYAPGIKGFRSVSDAAFFGTKFGLQDTLNGAIQLIPGDIGEANIARDWSRLEYAMEQYGAPVVSAYFAGLIADPIGLMIPISKLRIPFKIMKLGEKYLKAKDYAQVAAAGAIVGGVGYTPGEVGSEEWLKQKGIQTAAGAVGAPAMLGVGKGVSNVWRGGKNAKFGMSKNTHPIMPINRAQKNHMNATRTVNLGPKTAGERGWEKYSNSPTAIGASIGGAGGGFAAYNTDIGTDFTDKTLRDWFGDDEPRDWQKWVNGTLGVIVGGAGARKVFKDPRVARAVIPKHGQTDTYISAKHTRRGGERMIMEAHVMPLAAKLEKVSKPDRELLWKMVTKEDLDGDDVDKIAKLTPLMVEVNDTVHKLGKTLVDEGILSEKIWLQNKDKYLHRLYKKPNKAHAAVASGGFGHIADELRNRGTTKVVSLASWRKGNWGDGGRHNADGHKWEGWENTIKGKGYQKWKDEQGGKVSEEAEEFDPNWMSGRLVKKTEAKYLASPEEGRFEWVYDNPADAARGHAAKKANREREAKGSTSNEEPAATIKIRRDYTKSERESMGEVTDILDTFLATGRLLAYDGATAKMLKTIARNDSSKVVNPSMRHTVYIEPTDANKKKYGPMVDRYISEDVHADMQRFNGDSLSARIGRHAVARVYRKFNAWMWKAPKTIGNPAVQFGNFVSNIQHYDHAMAGMGMGKWKIFAESVREMDAFPRASRSRHAGKTAHVEGSDLNEALKRGLLDATMVSGELQGEGVEALRRIMAGQATMLERLTNADSALINYAANVTMKTWNKTGGVAVEKAGQLYAYGDNAFKFALFKAESRRFMEMGLSRDAAFDAAARKARSWFVDYTDPPPLQAFLRETGLPFVSYTYGIVPRLVETAMKHPMKVAKWAAIGHLANEAGWTMSDDSDREEVERLQEAQSTGFSSMWGIPGTSPTLIKNPDNLLPFFKDRGDNMGFWDIGRIYAGGDLFNGREGGAGQIKQFPGFAQPSFGAAGAIGYTLMSIDQFKGKTIPDGKKVEAFYRQFTPNIVGLGAPSVGLPDSYAQRKLRRAQSGQDETGVDNHTTVSALLSSVGMKITPVSLSKLRGRTGLRFKAEVGELRKEIKGIAKSHSNGDYHPMATGMSQEERDAAADKIMARKIESIVRGIERLSKKYRLVSDGD